jgi:hypothetical protein
MSHRKFLPLLALLAAAAAHAQQTQLKPGLWELAGTVKSQSGTVEKAMAEAQAQLAKLPPEQRRQIEQMMAARGVGIGQGGTTVRLCLSAADLAQGNVPVQSGDCTQNVVSRSGNTTKVDFSCRADPPVNGTGEVQIESPTAMRSSAIVNTTVEGKPERLDTTQVGRWLGEDCGSIRPPQR